MKFLVIWSAFAEDQLDEIFEYYHKKVDYLFAQKIVTEIINSTSILEKNPFLGPLDLFLIDRKVKYHYLVSGNYKLIYSVDENNKLVKIADVFDTRQNPTKIRRGK